MNAIKRYAFRGYRRIAKLTTSSRIVRWTPYEMSSKHWTKRGITTRFHLYGFTIINCWRPPPKYEKCAKRKTSGVNSVSSCTYRSRRGTSWDCCRGTIKCSRGCWVSARNSYRYNSTMICAYTAMSRSKGGGEGNSHTRKILYWK